MKFIYTIIILLFVPIFAFAEILPRTIYAVTPSHINSQTLKKGNNIKLYVIADEEYKNFDIGLKNNEEFHIKIKEYVIAKRGKRDGYYKVQYLNNGKVFDGKMKQSTPQDFENIAKKAGITIAGHILKIPGFSQAIAVSKGIIDPNEDESRMQSIGKNLYESTPLTYVEKGKEFDVEEDGIVVIKLKVKE